MKTQTFIQILSLGAIAISTTFISIATEKPAERCIAPTEVQQDSNPKATAPKFWTPARRIEYSKRRLDSSLFNSEYLDLDVEVREKFPWPTKAALEGIPSPVPKYPNDFGGALIVSNLEIGERELKGAVVAWGKSDVNRHLFTNESDNLLIYMNLFILTDTPKIENGKNTIVSRNWPHILSTGKQKTSIGAVDWVHIGFANDDNYAFISQRIFDLKFGNTIVVAPQKDGTLRFLQLDGPGSILHADRVKLVNEYCEKLEKDNRVIQLVQNENTLGGESSSLEKAN